MQLVDKVCLITGGTRGIGAATAMDLAEQGAHIALVGREQHTEAIELVHRIQAMGRNAVLLLGDMGKPKDCQHVVDETVAVLGALDVLVHSAGGAVVGGLLDLTPEAWLAAFDVHVHAIFHLCRAAIPEMRTRGEGSIMLISSAAGVRGVKTNIAYQTVKGALPQMTRALAYEFADDNIRVNCVAPGIIRTDFHKAMSAEAQKHNLDNRIPLHREGTSEQVATLIRELLTNDFITGETVSIDGGMTMRIA
ncbi:MAG: SDR family NAD(P)-dependent oxidoreductase [Chthonomonadales bacterium]